MEIFFNVCYAVFIVVFLWISFMLGALYERRGWHKLLEEGKINKGSEISVTPKKRKNLYDGCSTLGTGGGDED